MKSESCPSQEQLRGFVCCNVSEPQAVSIAEHLEQCPACEETVVSLERDLDTIAEQIRQAAAQPTFAHEPECHHLIQSLLDGTSIKYPAPPNAGAPFQVGQILRDYQIVAKLGEGGMGTIYKAVHQRLKKVVALKVLPTSRIGDPAAVARFEREMEVLGQLNHPHIVQAFDAGEHEGQHYLVMEYVEGRNLSDIVRRCSPLSIADACLLISQAAAGLQYAHENGFVHRDIKPSNLMLATTGMKSGPSVIVKILDLGLARALDQRPDAAAPNAELTTTGQVMGTLDYMAPEQGGDAHQVDIRADIYSLGATLYKLLTGYSPF
ncbi:MAG: serine/threonine-protein kinase, partial [Planctomycetaceae bacterium]